jgi:hypothetical protein
LRDTGLQFQRFGIQHFQFLVERFQLSLEVFIADVFASGNANITSGVEAPALGFDFGKCCCFA